MIPPVTPINTPPVVAISAPAGGLSVEQGTTVVLRATATDAEDGNLASELVWTSSIDGSIGTGSPLSLDSLTVGTHILRASASDSGGLTTRVAQQLIITAAPVNPPTNGDSPQELQVRVSSSADDAEERDGGRVGLSSSDLELIFDRSSQTVGIRFDSLALPAGAQISHAWIQFQTEDETSDPTALSIAAQAIDNAPAFTSTDYNISSRTLTRSSVPWAPTPWNDKGQADAAQRTPDLAALVQEVVSRPGWTAGNALAFVITGSGERVAESYDGNSSSAPLLIVEYTTDGGTTTPTPVNTPPSVAISAPGDQDSVIENVSLRFTASANDAEDGLISNDLLWSSNLDGPIGNGATFTTSTLSVGTHIITASVTDSDNVPATDALSIIILPDPNIPPIADAGAEQTYFGSNTSVLLDGRNSEDPDGEIVEYLWALEDGTQIGNGPVIDWLNTGAGTFRVELTVTDNKNATSTDETLITVVPDGTAAGVTPLLVGADVSVSQRHTQQTPIATHDGNIYLTVIEPGPNGDDLLATDLLTTVRKGEFDNNGTLHWQRVVIESRTANDAFHTTPAIGVDEEGYVHVAYNMHNFPWQYATSTDVADISSLEFRGQPITLAEIQRHQLQNRTTFPTLGSADLPGNQVTYPAFFNDRNGQLYASYRYAAKPARIFAERTLSVGVARYDVTTRQWTSLGGPLEFGAGDFEGDDTATATLRSSASATGWTASFPQLTFGPSNEWTVSSMWIEGGPGSRTTRPCAFITSDGTTFQTLTGEPAPMPSRPEDCSNIDTGLAASQTFLTLGNSTSDSLGNHHRLFAPDNVDRFISYWNGTAWGVKEVPRGAREIFFDSSDNLWALGHGLTVHVQVAGSTSWNEVYRNSSDLECSPRAALDENGTTAYVYLIGCDYMSVSVVKLDLDAFLAAN